MISRSDSMVAVRMALLFLCGSVMYPIESLMWSMVTLSSPIINLRGLLELSRLVRASSQNEGVSL